MLTLAHCAFFYHAFRFWCIFAITTLLFQTFIQTSNPEIARMCQMSSPIQDLSPKLKLGFGASFHSLDFWCGLNGNGLKLQRSTKSWGWKKRRRRSTRSPSVTHGDLSVAAPVIWFWTSLLSPSFWLWIKTSPPPPISRIFFSHLVTQSLIDTLQNPFCWSFKSKEAGEVTVPFKTNLLLGIQFYIKY